MTFGVTGDFASNPDLGVLTRGIEAGTYELLKASQDHHRRQLIPRSLNTAAG